MDPRLPAHFIFVDLENLPHSDLAPLAAHSVHVTLLVGKKQPDLLGKLGEQIVRLPFEVRLIKVGITGKNALDFALAFHLGEAAAHNPSAKFYIVSDDKKDFGKLILHIVAKRVHVSRHSSIAELPFLPRLPVLPANAEKQAKVAKKPVPKRVAKPAPIVVDRSTRVIERLNDPTRTDRPATEKSLLRKIKNDLGKGATDETAKETLNKAIREDVLKVNEKGKVHYTRPTSKASSAIAEDTPT